MEDDKLSQYTVVIFFFNFTSCDFCFLFSTFSTLIFLFCSILTTFSSFQTLFCSSLSFCFTLVCIISSYLSDVTTKGVCSIHCFCFCLVVSATDFTQIFILRCAETANLLPWENRFVLISLPKALIFSGDISCIEIYSFSKEDYCLRSSE